MKQKNNHETPSAEPSLDKTKKIKVWENGNPQCYVFNINPKDYGTWDDILHHISQIIGPRFGSVKKLVELKSEKEVLSFEELDSKQKYVALGQSSVFNKSNLDLYKTNKELQKMKEPSFRSFPLFAATKDEGVDEGGRVTHDWEFLKRTEKLKYTVVYIAVNGRVQTPHKAVFKEWEMKNEKFIINHLSKTLGVADGIHHFCTIYGRTLKGPSEFQHGYLFVAVQNKETFIHMDYMELLPKKPIPKPPKIKKPKVHPFIVLSIKKLRLESPTKEKVKKRKCVQVNLDRESFFSPASEIELKTTSYSRYAYVKTKASYSLQRTHHCSVQVSKHLGMKLSSISRKIKSSTTSLITIFLHPTIRTGNPFKKYFKQNNHEHNQKYTPNTYKRENNEEAKYFSINSERLEQFGGEQTCNQRDLELEKNGAVNYQIKKQAQKSLEYTKMHELKKEKKAQDEKEDLMSLVKCTEKLTFSQEKELSNSMTSISNFNRCVSFSTDQYTLGPATSRSFDMKDKYHDLQRSIVVRPIKLKSSRKKHEKSIEDHIKDLTESIKRCQEKIVSIDEEIKSDPKALELLKKMSSRPQAKFK